MEKHENSTSLFGNNTLNMDKLGMGLSMLCAVHCIVTPFVLLSLPMLTRYYVAHPLFHVFMAILIVPVGFLAFYKGYRHHHNSLVLKLGTPGLFLVGIVPIFFHQHLGLWSEPILMITGSALLIAAHWINRKSCACEHHHH